MSLFVMDMATIMVGDDNPNNLNHLTIESITLPVMSEKTVDHAAGGAVMEIKIGMSMLEALELSFKMKGLNPSVAVKFGMGQLVRLNYTIFGNVRDVLEDRLIPARVKVRGRMVKLDQGEFSRESGVSEDYMINEILKYEAYFDNQEKFYFDFARGPAGARIDGQPIFAQQAINLGLA
jgi:P2 family phage contractile tail tube protein